MEHTRRSFLCSTFDTVSTKFVEAGTRFTTGSKSKLLVDSELLTRGFITPFKVDPDELFMADCFEGCVFDWFAGGIAITASLGSSINRGSW